MNTSIKDGGTAFPMQDPQAIHAYAQGAVANLPKSDVAERDRAYLAARAQAVGGMSLRDYFAAKAMQGFLSGHIAHYGHENHWAYGPLASEAYELADAMLKAREGGATGNLSTERDTLRDAMREIATTEANSNSDPDVMGAALDNVVAVAQGALRACQKQGAA